MKKWSTKWKSSTQPKKQRKYKYNAPLHARRKFLSTHLSKELIKKYNTRSIPLRNGDEVEIMRGKYKKKKGKIIRVDLKKFKVYIEGVTRKRVAGAEVLVGFDPSNLRIVRLNLTDKKRLKTLKLETAEETEKLPQKSNAK
jgi:large subunit ribosomal protein L24